MSLLPPDDDLELLHTRNYETRVYLIDDATVLVRGIVQDEKPPGLYVEDDPDPLVIHSMVVTLKVSLPSLEILDAGVDFASHPHSACPAIVAHYKKLIGISIARGFTHKVRELFGGPRGCTHTTALLQAMAPAVVQSTWSVGLKRSQSVSVSGADAAADRERRMAGNVNTCHIWDEHGEHVMRIRQGERGETMIPIAKRLDELGRSHDEWNGRFDSKS